MNEVGHLFLFDATVDQLARLILGHGSPFLERHGTAELGPRWVLRCERHDGLDISTLGQSGFVSERFEMLQIPWRRTFAWTLESELAATLQPCVPATTYRLPSRLTYLLLVRRDGCGETRFFPGCAPGHS